MNRENDRTLQSRLSDALAAEDPPAALEALARDYAADPEALEQIEGTRQVVIGLVQMGRELDRSAPSPAPIRLPRARLVWWRAAAVAAAAAAAVAAAVLLSSSGPTKVEQPEQLAAASAPAEPPFLEAISTLGGFEMPSLSAPGLQDVQIPTVQSPELEGVMSTSFSLPVFTWPSVTERSTNHGTQT